MRSRLLIIVLVAGIVGAFIYAGQDAEAPILADPQATSSVAGVTATQPASRGVLSSGIVPYHADMKVFGSIPYWDQARAISVFKENVEVFDVISVFWYRLDEDGAIAKYRDAKEDPSLIQYAKANDVKILALIANLPEDDDWDAERVATAIGTPEARAAHIRAIVDLVVSKDFDGAYIDYEFLRNRQTEDFSTFIRELAAALHAEARILGVAVHAQAPGGATRGQDLAALQSADIISFMTYDEHWETGDAGPVASLPWVRRVLEHAVSLGLDMRKVYMGIPLYGYDWPRQGLGWGDAAGMEYEEVLARAQRYGATIEFDSAAVAPKFTYTNGGVEHQVWFEDVRSFEAKYELAQEFGVGGILFWRQGREDMRVYEILGR